MKKRRPLNILIDAPEADILCQVNGAYTHIYSLFKSYFIA